MERVSAQLSSGALGWSRRQLHMLHCFGVLLSSEKIDINSHIRDKEALVCLLVEGQFASPDSDCKVQIAQRGAITPLIKMLQSSDEQVMEMSAFALGRLAQVLNVFELACECFCCFWNLVLYG